MKPSLSILIMPEEQRRTIAMLRLCDFKEVGTKILKAVLVRSSIFEGE
jgi:hypothetical protein